MVPQALISEVPAVELSDVDLFDNASTACFENRHVDCEEICLGLLNRIGVPNMLRCKIHQSKCVHELLWGTEKGSSEDAGCATTRRYFPAAVHILRSQARVRLRARGTEAMS